MAVLACENNIEEQKDYWKEVIEKKVKENSVISIGSPHTCFATEHLLGEMFDTEPYEPEVGNLPFRMFLSDKKELWYPSTYVVTKEDTEKMELTDSQRHALNKIRGNNRAFVIKDEIFESQREGDNYGMVVLGKRTKRKSIPIRMAIFGTNGTATYAATEAIAKGIVHSDILEKNNKNSDIIMLAVVRAKVERKEKPGMTSLERDIKDIELAMDPVYFKLEEKKWVEMK